MALLKAFNPHELSADLVHNVATGREWALNKIISTVRSNLDASTKHHFIVSAPRGYGKSFFLRYVEITIGEIAKVEGLPLAMALLPEELPHVKEPDTLIAEIRRTFLKAPADTVSVRWSEDDGNAWDEAITELDVAIDERFGAGRGLLVVGVENFDLLIPKAFAKSVQSARLRSFLTRPNGRIMLLAASARGAFDRSYDAPLFQAFEELTLAPWSIDEVVAFLDAQRRISGKTRLTEVQRARAKAVAVFISGTPRLATLIGGALLDDDPLQAAELLERLVDELTPYYKERVDILPPRPQALLDALLRGGEPCSATELARRVGAPAQSAIAAPLDDLRKDLLISGEKATDSAEVLLRVTDRVFAHYYRKRVLNHGQESCPLESLVDLLALIYSPEEKKHHAEEFNARGLSREAEIMEKLWQMDERSRLASLTDTEENGYDALMAQWNLVTDKRRFDVGLSFVDRAIAVAAAQNNVAREANALIQRAWTLDQMGRYEEALATAKNAAVKAETVGALSGETREEVDLLRIMARSLMKVGRREDAIATARKAIAKAERAGGSAIRLDALRTLLLIRPDDATQVLDAYEWLVHNALAAKEDTPRLYFSDVASVITAQQKWPALVAILSEVPEVVDLIVEAPFQIGEPGAVIAASYKAGRVDDALMQARHFITSLAQAIKTASEARFIRLWNGLIQASVNQLAIEVDNAQFLGDLADIVAAHPDIPAGPKAILAAVSAYHLSGRDPAKLVRLDPDVATMIKTVFRPKLQRRTSEPRPKKKKRRSR